MTLCGSKSEYDALDRAGMSVIEARFRGVAACAATHLCFADVAELVDAPDLGSGAERRGGSSPLIRTTVI